MNGAWRDIQLLDGPRKMVAKNNTTIWFLTTWYYRKKYE